MLRILPLLFIALSCTAQVHFDNQETPHPSEREVLSEIDTAKLGIRLHPVGRYDAVKASIKKNISLGKTGGKDLEEYLLNEIIPFWYGTPWDFNGYTAVPNQGVIACGYFVSTTLLHAGLNVNRYHLAQQAGLNEAKSLGITEEHWKWMNGIEALEKQLQTYEDGLYFVGLDNHVGYLLIRGGGYYFVHSNYIENRVMIEEALTAPAFQSEVYVVAEITTNELLLQRWRTGAVVPVVRN